MKLIIIATIEGNKRVFNFTHLTQLIKEIRKPYHQNQETVDAKVFTKHVQHLYESNQQQ